MLQRILGVSIGAIITFLLLLLFNGGQRIVSDANQGYLWASIIGAITSFFWPIVIGWFLVRRHRERQQNQVQAEVERQLAEQQGPK
jgi:ABC-type Fe3+-siderophore transport system permease subunit